MLLDPITGVGWRPRRLVGWLLPTCIGCISTDLKPPPMELPCVAADGPLTSINSVVGVTTVDGLGYLNCSGVKIAPTLVLTAATCVFEALGGDDSDTELRCDTASDWAPLERGSLSAEIGEPFDLSLITVSDPRQPRTDVRVREVRTAGTKSRCRDDLALIVLERVMDVPGAPLRLDETSRAGESVTLSTRAGVDDVTETANGEYRIEEVTFESGSSLSPPRSLLIDGQVCPFEWGSPVFSSDTGALTGVISWNTEECGERGKTVATRLAPFRRFLAEAAADFGESLRLEPNPSSNEELPACPID